MLLKYVQARKAHIKGPYVKALGGGKSVRIDLGQVVEVEDALAYKILAHDSDIIKQVEKVKKDEKPAEKAAPKPANKAVKSYQNKDLGDGPA